MEMIEMHLNQTCSSRRRFPPILVVFLSLASLVGCDLEVNNPGPVQDENLAAQGAHPGLVNAAVRSTQWGLGWYAYLGGAIVGDLMPSGHTGASGTQPEEEVALLTDEWDGRGSWGNLHRGRWIAEEALRRFSAEGSGVDVNTYPLAAEAHLWAGFASRMLGENACTAVFDGGPPLPKEAYFDRAIEHFDRAEIIAQATGQQEMVTAAVGARAAANAFIGNWVAARADAQRVPFDFRFTTKYSGWDGEWFQIFGGGMSLAFQSVSLWGTPMHIHFLETGDSRVAWGYDNGGLEVPAGQPYAVRAQTHPARPSWQALIPMYYPLKGIAPRNPARELRFFEPILAGQRELQVNLVTGREMELILAEAALSLDGRDWPTAMAHINTVRTNTPVYAADLSTAMDLTLHPLEQRDKDRANLPDYFTGAPGDFSAGGTLAPVSAANLEEAWAALKSERLFEFNLEGRRLGDRWRWRENGTPGDIHPLEYVPTQLAERYGVPEDPLNLCFPMPRDEKESSPNVPSEFRDWNTP